MNIRSIKYPKLLTVEVDGREITRAVKKRDIEGPRWTKQGITRARKDFTRFCEHVIGLALGQGDQARAWLGDNVGDIARRWDHYANFSAEITAHTVALRARIDIDGSPSNYVHFRANVDLTQLEKQAKERHDA